MNAICPVCDFPLKDGDKLAIVALSTFVAIDSDVSFAVTEPTKCIELLHRGCYDFGSDEERERHMEMP